MKNIRKTFIATNSLAKKNFYWQVDISSCQLLQKHLDLELCFKAFVLEIQFFKIRTDLQEEISS